MKRVVVPALLTLILSLLTSSCLTVFVPVGTPTPGPTAIELPTLAPTASLPVEPVQPASTQLQSAPMCAVDPLVSSCAAPNVEARDKFCVKKYPYVLVAAPPGVTFEPVSAGLKCTDEGLRGGDQIISCSGDYLTSYNLKICSAACSASLLDTTSGKCPTGYGYAAEGGCCWPVPATDAGCILFKVDIGACN